MLDLREYLSGGDRRKKAWSTASAEAHGVPEFSELLWSSQFANTVDVRRLQQEQGMYRQSPNS